MLPPTLSPADFATVRTLLHQRAAIVLEDGKEYFVEARLLPLTQREGCVTLAEMISKLRLHPFGPLHRRAIDALTINETTFFRDLRSFEVLRKAVLPEAIARNARTRRLNIWSAACSSGQEPYSVAMLLRENFPQLRNWIVRLCATDLSQEMVERSRAGCYSQLEVKRGLPAPMLVKYFARSGLDWSVREELKEMIEFAPLNLIGDWPRFAPLDVVLLRNVMIYFDVETKKRLLQRVRSLLAPGGVLLLGAAETTLNLDDDFVRVPLEGSYIYRNPG